MKKLTLLALAVLGLALAGCKDKGGTTDEYGTGSSRSSSSANTNLQNAPSPSVTNQSGVQP